MQMPPHCGMPTLIEMYTRHAMRLIRADQEEGLVPAGVAGFQELHDYVDANEYVEHVPYGPEVDLEDPHVLANLVTLRVDQALNGLTAHQ